MMKVRTITALTFLGMTLGVACSAPPQRGAVAQERCFPPEVTQNVPQSYKTPHAFAGERALSLEAVAQRSVRYRAILIDEQHDRLDHHLNQLEIACRVHRLGAPIAIGFEAFQQPFQASLDDYVAGKIGLAALLERTQYYERWRFDHRLYAPIFEFARLHAIPMVALNVSRQVSRNAAAHGLDHLSPGERAQFPFGLQEPGPAYRARVKAFFGQHPDASGVPRKTPERPVERETEAARLERFIRVQWSWDEAMGQRAARYLLDNPERSLVVIAGTGHIAYADAIPGRLLYAGAAETNTQGLSVVRVLQAVARPGGENDEQFAATYSAQVRASDDVWLDTAELRLAKTGRLGVFLEARGGDVAITSLANEGAAARAGMKAGDRLIRIDSKAISSYTEVKIALAESKPGDTVNVDVLRHGEPATMGFAVTLR